MITHINYEIKDGWMREAVERELLHSQIALYPRMQSDLDLIASRRKAKETSDGLC